MNDYKLILIIYVPNQYATPAYISKMSGQLEELKDRDKLNASFFIIPSTTDTDLRIECINPQYLSKDDYLKNITPIITELKEYIDTQHKGKEL